MSNLRISVCIPTFNQELFVEQSIRSALNQTVSPFEIIVSNDCSTDGTKETLDKLSEEISILKVINQPQNLGISKNTNFCLRQATGDFIIRLDSDDLLSPDYIKLLSEELYKYPEAGYAHAAVNEIDKNNNFLKERKLIRKSGFVNGEVALKASLSGYRVTANIIMFRKKALETVGYISSKINFAEDYYLSAQLAAAGYGNLYSEKVLASYRVWTDTGKVRQKRKLEEIDGIRSIFDEVIEPAFETRGWNLAVVKSAREKFAINQSNCLGWSIYTDQEKIPLITALLELSDTKKSRFFVWLYKNGYGVFPESYYKLNSKIKGFGKNMLLNLTKKQAVQ
ncbi:glycosyltransferase family 2 protein [Mucilaginibacter sp. OK098]|uniref:glycosyltransferase family 2 protein n=1 Tax=Mucilaginibacter sp. OK098 TaxID=1855297 RepID=UPI000914146F|nr:glycosyltransferase family 2 protein [Mucilaginibacter sp. OK098]SHN19550.1 hypothetical protein SAMN05216524_106310 [Mucilaginibacter sp. OK098]